MTSPGTTAAVGGLSQTQQHTIHQPERGTTMSSMTTTSRLPSCPPYCGVSHRGVGDWEELADGSGYVRSHNSDVERWRGVDAEGGAVSVWVSTNEHEDGHTDPSTVAIDSVPWGPSLTPAQARDVARYLLEAADVAEEAEAERMTG